MRKMLDDRTSVDQTVDQTNGQAVRGAERRLSDGTPARVDLYSARLVAPVTAPVIFEGAVAVRGGRVLHVGTRRWVLSALESDGVRGADIHETRWDGLLTPGLVNAHTHLQYTGMAQVGRGTYPTFRAWEDAFDEVYEPARAEKPWKRWADEGARQLLRAGTSAAADVVTDFEAAGALHDAGLHGIAYWEVMGWHNDEWVRRGRRELLDHLARLRAGHIPNLGISPHAPYSLGSAPFVDLPDIARQLGMRLHIHLAESPMEAGQEPAMLTTYSSQDWQADDFEGYRDLKRRGKKASAVQFVDHLGSLGPDVHIAHGVWVDKEDRRLLRQRGVAVALCPRSNRITHTGRPAPVADYLREGNMLAIGTDSLSSSPSLDVLDDAREVYRLAREQGYAGDDLSHRILRMLTLGGAEAMGLNCGPGRIGQINAGAPADLAFFRIPITSGRPEDIEEAVSRFVCEGAGTNALTIVSGRVAYDGRG